MGSPPAKQGHLILEELLNQIDRFVLKGELDG